MRFFLAAILYCVAAACSAQSANDLVHVWLAQNGKTAGVGDYTTCQVGNAADGICSWNDANLGAQPTTAQLDALSTTWANQQIAAEYQLILNAGLAVTSTATPALNATYPIDPTSQFNISAEIVSIQLNGTFTNGLGTKPWIDVAGAVHNFTTAQFKTFATSVSQYVDALVTARSTLQSGQSATWPTATVTIP